jgi:uncharacterized protein YecE (DUF72 family)
MAKRKRSEETLSLFGEEGIPRSTPAPSAYILHNRDRLKRWASKGILFGGSSWKYPGWKGIIYSKDYKSKQAFNEQCLAEYSEVFSTVCADFALYDFPDEKQMKLIHDSTNDTFRVSLKVTDRITIRRYPSLPRFGQFAGTVNPNFLNVELFEDAFLRPLEELGQKRGAIIFEFSTFHPNSGITYGKYVDLVDLFLARLPGGYEYSVELRNSEFLTTEYLTMLTSHGVAHVLNNWTRMPPIINQIKIAGVLTARFSVARALLKPGRSYQEAVETFQPYDTVKEENPELRMGLVESVHRCIAEGKKLYAYVNNRAEGNSPKTIEGILDTLDNYPAEKL